MTLNDFKSVEGDTRMGVRSLPVQLGVDRPPRPACGVMVAPQIAVVAILLLWGRSFEAFIVAALLAAQLLLMRPLLVNPKGKAAWYNAPGTTLYVLGMLVAAFALRPAVEALS
jgi:chlorophyll synthase